MARVWQCGFELNSLTTGMEISATSGTISVQTPIARSGTYALRTNAGTSFVRQHLAASNQSTQVWARVYLWIATLPGATTAVIRLATTANATCAQLGLTTSGTLVLNDASGATVGSASAALSTGAWYQVELGLDASTNPGTVTARLEGAQFATGANSSQASWARALIGIIGSTTGDLYWDDWAVNDASGTHQTSWPGSGKIIHLFPNGDGDNHAWGNTTNGAGASTNSTLVDEIPPNDSTDLVQSVTLNAEDAYTLTDSGIGSLDAVNVVMVGARLRNNTADATTAAKLQIKKTSGGTITQGTAVIPNTTTFFTNATAEPRNYPLITYTDPDGAVWTQATLDTAQAGIKLTAAGTNRVQMSALWVSVDYTPTVTSSDTGAGVEASTLATALTSADTAAGAEASTLAATAASADTGAGTDAGTLAAALASAETGAGTEASSLTTALTSADTGAAAEASTLAATVSATDTASGTEAASLVVQVSDTDTGTAIEATSLTTALLGTETGSGLDGTTDRTLSAIETATAAEAATLAVVLTDSDTGSGVDTGTQTATLTSADTASGAETSVLVTALTAADTAAGAEASGLTTALTASDTASGAEASVLAAQLLSAETAAGDDAGTVDDGSSNDRAVSSSDISATAETNALAATLTSADTATAVEAATVSVQLTSADTGAAADVATQAATLVATDTGTATEANTLTVALSAAETATAFDLAIDPAEGTVTLESLDVGPPATAWTARRPERGWAAGVTASWSAGSLTATWSAGSPTT